MDNNMLVNFELSWEQVYINSLHGITDDVCNKANCSPSRILSVSLTNIFVGIVETLCPVYIIANFIRASFTQ